ncbi:MAG: hypothetical protein ACREU3_13850 [Steroidobacteraceae bacterium]
MHEARAGDGQQAVHRLALKVLWSLLAYRNVWLVAVGAAGFMIWLFLVNAFAPLHITKVAHQTGTAAGFLMGAAGLGSFFIGLIAPGLSDRFGRCGILGVEGFVSALLPLALLFPALCGHS